MKRNNTNRMTRDQARILASLTGSAPAIPPIEGFEVNAAGNIITLEWTVDGIEDDDIQIQVSDRDAEDWSLVVLTGVPVGTTTDDQPQDTLLSLDYRCRRKRDGLYSAWSATLQIDTIGISPIDSFTAERDALDAVLSWSVDGPAGDQIVIEAKSGAGSYGEIATLDVIGGTTTEEGIGILAPLRTYRAKRVRDAVSSDWSAEVSIDFSL